MAVLDGRNRAKPEEIASFLDKFEDYEKEKATIMAEAMNKCKKVTERQSDLLDDAKNKGWAKKVIKDAVKIRKKHREIRELMADQEQDTADDLDKLLKAIGGLADLPLGQAAMEAADPKAAQEKKDQERTAAVVEAVQKDEAEKKSGKKDAKPDEFFDSKKPATVQ